MGILNKLKCYFPKKILLQLYHALIYLHLLQILSPQNFFSKAVKIVTQTKWNSSANPSYTNLKVLKLNKLYTINNIHIAKTNTSQSPSDIPALPAVSQVLCLPSHVSKVRSCNNLSYTRVLKPETLFRTILKFPPFLSLSLILSSSF